MMVVTPIFAAYTAVFSMITVDSWMSKDKKDIEVPILGNINDEDAKEENNKKKSEENLPNNENNKQKEQAKETTPVESTSQKQEVKKSTNQTTKTSVKTSQKSTPKATEKKQEAKPDIKSAKEICEARTEGPTTLIKVHFLSYIEKFPLIEFLNMEDPAADYYKYAVKDNKNAKMVYINNSCVPSKDNLVLIEEKTLETSELSTYHITAKSDYESWF